MSWRKSVSRKVFLAAILAGATAISARSISGTITDKATGNPLAGALVTRLSDTAQAVTDSLGNYAIPEHTTAVAEAGRVSVSPDRPIVSGNVLRFNAAYPQPVRISRYTLDGRFAEPPVKREVQAGAYTVNLTAPLNGPAGVLITHILVNGADYSFRSTFLNGRAIGSGAVQSASGKSAGFNASAIALSKSVAIADSIAISRFGYKKTVLPLSGAAISTTLENANLFVSVDGGTFTQGTDDTSRARNQRPAHQVTLSNYLINKYSTTFDDFDAFAVANKGAKPSSKTWRRGSTPVINVSFYDIVLFANWQSKKDGLTPVYAIDSATIDTNNVDTADHRKWTVVPDWNASGYRLLTEAEYEYAARGGKLSHGYLYSGSDTLGNVAWTGNDTLADGTLLGIQPVGRKQANELGIFDLSGNTGTLTWDKAYSVTVPAGATPSTATYPTDAVTNPKGIDGKYNRRVKRGGGPMSDESCNLVTARFFKKAGSGSQCFGLRLARSK
jgi:formylglycine-generating enzyme required for sulfatase activity